MSVYCELIFISDSEEEEIREKPKRKKTRKRYTVNKKSNNPDYLKCSSCRNYTRLRDFKTLRNGKKSKTCLRCLQYHQDKAHKERYLIEHKKKTSMILMEFKWIVNRSAEKYMLRQLEIGRAVLGVSPGVIEVSI